MIIDHYDCQLLAVAGDSSGGTLAAAVSLMARDYNIPMIKYQVLIYPVTDYYNLENQSYIDYAKGYSLESDTMIWFWHHYYDGSGVDLNSNYICPLRAESLKDIPPTLIITAEYDPLRDEGEAYAQRLLESGVKVTLKRYNDVMHGFMMSWRTLDKGMKLLVEVGRTLSSSL